MAVEKIIIELAADTTELQPAIDQLEALGKIDAATAKAFRETNAAISQRAKSLGDVTTAQKQVTEGSKQTAANYEKLSQSFTKATQTIQKGSSKEILEGFFQGVGDALKEAGVSVEEFAQKLSTGLGSSSGPLGQAGERTTTLRTQLRQLKEELAGLDPGDARFEQLTKEAALLEDKIGDVNLQVRNLASDTAALDGTIQSIQGVAGAFQVVEGAAALFGDESEELQQTLVKLTALMNVTNGLQGIQNLLQRQSAATLLVVNAQQKIGVALKALEGATESKNIIIRTAAIASQRALNAAMAANPAGILIVALGALAGALLLFTSRTEDAAEAQTKFNESQLGALQATEEIEKVLFANLDTQIERLQTEIEIARIRGASALQLAQMEKQLADLQAERAAKANNFHEEEIKDIGRLRNEMVDLLDDIRKLNQQATRGDDVEKQLQKAQSRLAIIRQQIALQERLAKATTEAEIAQIRAEEAILKAKKEAADVSEKERELVAARKAAQLQALEDEKAGIEIKLLDVKKGTEEEILLRQQLLDTQAVIDLISLEGTRNTEAQRNLIVKNSVEEQKKVRTEGEKAIIQAIFDEQQKFGQSDLFNIQSRLSSAEKGSAEELQLRKDVIEAQADLDKNAAQAKFELSEKNLADEKLFASEIVQIDSAATAAKKDLDKDYYDNKQKLRDADLAKEEAAAKQIIGILVQLYSQAANARFDNQRQQIENQEQLQLQALEKEKNNILKNENLTASQKEKIEEKFAKREAAIKEAAWEAEQKALESRAIMQAFLASVNTLASGGPFPANVIAAAGVLALGLAQAASIANQQPPNFRYGVEKFDGEGTGTSDSIWAKVSKGERVITADTNAQYFPALHAIHTGEVSPEFANAALTGGFHMKPVTSTMVEKSRSFSGGNFSIDYDKMAQKIADAQWEDLDTLNDSVRKGTIETAGLLERLGEVKHNVSRRQGGRS